MTEKKSADSAQRPNPKEDQAGKANESQDAPDALAQAVSEAEVAIMQMVNELRRPYLRGKFNQKLVSLAADQFELGFLALHKVANQAGGQANG